MVLRFIKLKLRGALVASPLRLAERAVWAFSAGVWCGQHYTVEQILTSRFGSMSG